MIVIKLYEVVVDGELHKFRTSLTEREFYDTLDAIYGEGKYIVVCVEVEE